jgi:hypothetical protein
VDELQEPDALARHLHFLPARMTTAGGRPAT